MKSNQIKITNEDSKTTKKRLHTLSLKLQNQEL